MSDRARELVASALVLVLTMAVGAALGSAWAGLAGGLALVAGRHLYHLARLARVMTVGEKVPGALPGGLWRTVYGGAGRLRSRSRKRKRRLSRFVSRFREAAAALPDAAVVIGAEGRIEWLNPAASRLLGLRSPADVNVPLVDRVRDPGLDEYLAGSDDGRSIQLRSPADGSKILSVRAVPFGRKRQRLLVARDVTRTHLADDAAEDFVANVSHELRTPLTVIAGCFEELGDLLAHDGEAAQVIDQAREQAARMNGIVADLLELSRLQMRPPEREPAPVPVPALLDGIAAEAAALSGERTHAVKLEVDRDLEILGDEKLIRSAISNLVFNAVRHTPPRTQIVLSWWRDAAGAHLRVRDSGEGIATRHIPRLTERFYRVDESRSRDTGGTGLGLSIVAHALERHGAELRIESAAGGGATFTCHFPAGIIAERPA